MWVLMAAKNADKIGRIRRRKIAAALWGSSGQKRHFRRKLVAFRSSPTWPKSHHGVRKPGIGALPHPDRHDRIDMAHGQAVVTGALCIVDDDNR